MNDVHLYAVLILMVIVIKQRYHERLNSSLVDKNITRLISIFSYVSFCGGCLLICCIILFSLFFFFLPKRHYQKMAFQLRWWAELPLLSLETVVSILSQTQVLRLTKSVYLSCLFLFFQHKLSNNLTKTEKLKRFFCNGYKDKH